MEYSKTVYHVAEMDCPSKDAHIQASVIFSANDVIINLGVFVNRIIAA